MNGGSILGAYYNTNNEETRLLMLLGFAFWQLSSTALGVCANVISIEAGTGTLEIKLLGKIPVTFLLFARLLAGILFGIVSLFFVVLLAILFKWLPLNELFLFFRSMLIYVPSLLGMFGIGLLFGGITLKEKNIGQFLLMVQTGLLFISNIFSVNDSFLLNIIPYLFGTKISRNLFLNNTIEVKDMFFYLIINLSWLIFGVIFFNLMLKWNKKKGFFSAY